MTPPKSGIFTNIGKNFCWNAAIWRPCSQKFRSFLLPAYFCEKKSWIGIKCIFYEYWIQTKNILRKKVMVCLKGKNGVPLNTLKLFPAKCFTFFSSSIFMKNAFSTNSRFFSQKYAHNKKEKFFWQQGLQIAAFQLSFSQWWLKGLFLEGSLIQKPT